MATEALQPYSLPIPQFQAESGVTPVRYAEPVISTEASSTALAAMSLAESLGKLPETLMAAYQEGKRQRISELGEEQIASRIKSGDLSDLTVQTGPKGTEVTLNKQDPYADLKAMIAQQTYNQKQAGPARYQNLANRIGNNQPLPAGGASAPAAPAGAPGPLSEMPADPSGGSAPNHQSSANNAVAGDLSAMGGEAPLRDANQDPIATAAQEKGGTLAGMSDQPYLDEDTGLIYKKDVFGNQVTVSPEGEVRVLDKSGAKKKEGFNFASVEEANAFAEKHGFNSPKIKQEDGKLIVEEFTPKDVDEKGKVKLTDSTRKELSSAANLMADLRGLETQQEQLYNENKAGPIAGRIEQFKAKMGFGDAGYVGAAGQIDVGQFKIARLLNGPGVLTDKDINRAQSVAPTLNETPQSFKAKMTNVRRMLRESVDTWLKINGSGATPSQKELAEAALKALSDEGGATGETSKPASGNIPAELQKRRQLIEQGIKADGTKMTPKEKAAAEILLQQLERKHKAAPQSESGARLMGSVLG